MFALFSSSHPSLFAAETIQNEIVKNVGVPDLLEAMKHGHDEVRPLALKALANIAENGKEML